MNGRLLVLLAGLVAGPGQVLAGPQHLLIGLDNKTFFEAKGSRNGPNEGDAVLVVDTSDPARPRIVASLPLPNSVYGPPSNLQITPDGRLGLVASSVTMRQEGEAWYAQADDRLHVIDLEADPPRLVETIRVGRQPSGLAIHPSGRLALVGNREGKSVSVLAIEGRSVRQIAEVPLGDAVAAVTFTPDGKRALAAKNLAAKVAVLAVDGTRVTYDSALDVPVGAGVYAVEVTPDGRTAVTADVGVSASDGHADTMTVIRLDQDPPRVVGYLTVGDTPETVAIAPDGRHAAVVVVKGSAAPHDAWSFTPRGATVLVSLTGERPRIVDEVPAGGVPEGIAFSPDGSHVYVGNYVDRTLQVYRREGDRLVDTGAPLLLPGQPASLRGPAPGLTAAR
ncbi:MAG TPA: YncE family protein [Beijerinckiaceae bacterium]|jgi:DNA-binding beta-propeller fold protein YncE